MKARSTSSARATRGAATARPVRATPGTPRAKNGAASRAKKGATASATIGSRGAPAADTARWRVRPEIAHREVEGQVVLLLPHADELFTLNDSARVVWRKLVAGASVAELGRVLAKRYGIPQATAESDVQVLVRELARRRIVARGGQRR